MMMGRIWSIVFEALDVGIIPAKMAEKRGRPGLLT